MGKNQHGRLLASELEILEALWSGSGGLTIVEVQRMLTKPTGYTSVQTRLNRMVAKSLTRRSVESPARYTAGLTREQASQMDLETLLSRVSQGQVIPLVAQLVRNRQLSEAEFNELRALIDQAEHRSQPKRSDKR